MPTTIRSSLFSASTALLVLMMSVYVDLPARAAEADAGKPQELLIGKWDATEIVERGDQILPQEGVTSTFTFTKDECKVVVRLPKLEQKTLVFKFRLDPAAGQAIDLTPQEGEQAGKDLSGIFEVTKDTLKLCVTAEPGQPRPTDFTSPKDAKVTFVTLKRAKN